MLGLVSRRTSTLGSSSKLNLRNSTKETVKTIARRRRYVREATTSIQTLVCACRVVWKNAWWMHLDAMNINLGDGSRNKATDWCVFRRTLVLGSTTVSARKVDVSNFRREPTREKRKKGRNLHADVSVGEKVWSSVRKRSSWSNGFARKGRTTSPFRGSHRNRDKSNRKISCHRSLETSVWYRNFFVEFPMPCNNLLDRDYIQIRANLHIWNNFLIARLLISCAGITCRARQWTQIATVSQF